MYRKVLVAGVTAAAIVGAGTTALAVTGSDATSGKPTTPSAASVASHPGKNGKHGKDAKLRMLRRAVHGEIVTKGKSGFVTHDLISGLVTKVSTSSITVTALDKRSETFAVTKDTKVRQRSAGKGSPSTIGKVNVGDKVFVLGVGTARKTARHIIDVGKK